MPKSKFLPLIATVSGLAVAFALSGAPAFAKGKPEKAQQKSMNHAPSHHEEGGVDVSVSIGIDTRNILHDYYGTQPACPPGLAKKHNGCMPPGQAKKRYRIGQPLSVGYDRLPSDLQRGLPPPPSGYIYGRVDDDILLIAEATHKVVDAVVAVTAASNAVK